MDHADERLEKFARRIDELSTHCGRFYRLTELRLSIRTSSSAISPCPSRIDMRCCARLRSMRHSARQCEHAIVDADPITRTRLCENVVRSVRLQADLRSRPLKSIVRIAVFRAICRVRLKPDTTFDGC